jgi:hypothetical protein
LASHALGQAAESDAALSELIADHAEIAAYDIAQVCAKRGKSTAHSNGWSAVTHSATPGCRSWPTTDCLRRCTTIRGGPLLRKIGLVD